MSRGTPYGKTMSAAGWMLVGLVAAAAAVITVLVVISHNKNKGSRNPSSWVPSSRSPSSRSPLPGPDATIQAAWRSRGLLSTGFTLPQMCSAFAEQQSPCPSPSDCDVPDISDYNALINIVSTKQDYVSCFALATSLQKQGLAQLSFGPMGGQLGDVTVGLFLDMNVLGKYVACMWPMDSGSIGRYGSGRESQALAITPEQISSSKGYSQLIENCKERDQCGLYLAGCANSGGHQAQNGYFFTDQAYVPASFQPPTGPPEVPKAWNFQNGGLQAFAHPKDDDPNRTAAMDEFLKTTVVSQQMLGAQSDPSQWNPQSRCATARDFTGLPVAASEACPDYWAYQFLGAKNADGYRETELDVFVPQAPGSAETAPGVGLGCRAHTQFVDDFRQAVLGVYATKYCANATPLVKDAKPGPSQCCNQKFSEQLAVLMAAKYNSSPKVKELKLPTIKAFLWDAADPAGRWQPDPKDPRLRLTVIT